MNKISKRRAKMGEEAWAEYQRKRKNAKAYNWQRKNVDNVVRWRQRAKEKLIAYKGGKCEMCNYCKEVPSAFAFHHLDPDKKDFGIGGKTLAFETLKAEVDKCMLLCVRCHAEVHQLEFEKIKLKTIEKFNEKADKAAQDLRRAAK